MDICHRLMQTAITRFFALTTPETSSLPLQSVHNDSRHNEERSQTFHPHNTVVPFQDKKAMSILFTQHNVESMHMQRLLEISRLASVEGVLIMTCQGTRWRFSNTINTPTHRCFFQTCGTTPAEAHAGNIIFVAHSILQGSVASTCCIDPYRSFLVRVKSKFHDFSIICYCSGRALYIE